MRYLLIIYSIMMLLIKRSNYREIFNKDFKTDTTSKRDDINYGLDKLFGKNKYFFMVTVFLIIAVVYNLYYIVSLFYINNVYFTFISTVLLVVYISRFKGAVDFIKEKRSMQNYNIFNRVVYFVDLSYILFTLVWCALI